MSRSRPCRHARAIQVNNRQKHIKHGQEGDARKVYQEGLKVFPENAELIALMKSLPKDPE